MSENPSVPPPVIETIPSVDGGVSGVASAHAPFLYFEDAPAFGHLNGIISITLTAARLLPVPGAPGPGSDHVVVAHLRMSISAASALKATLEGALLLAMPAAGAERPS